MREDWERRDLRLLEAFATAEAAGDRTIASDDLASRLGLELHDAWIGLRALHDAGYIAWSQRARYSTDRHQLYGPGLQERGRRAIGSWPREGVDSLIALLEARIVVETDHDRRSRLEQLRDALLGVGRDVGTNLLTAWLRGQIGI